ncbi:MAG: hypothetical protein EBR95_06680 [Verrucomicrobia bacterium]|nr:hypothetical protein [Verrucomicrobiota bacterium]
MKSSPVSWLVALLMLASAAFASDPRRVLFIGNSYTGVNKLPEVFLEVVKSSGRPAPVVKSSTPGGRTLRQHLGIAGSLALIDEGGWDVVVLQGQSQEPAIAERDESVRKDFLESAEALCLRVRAKSPQVRIFFYETWARHADYWKAAKKGPDVGVDPKEMQARLRKWYGVVSKDNGATFVPCGDAWELNYASAVPLRMHTSDHSHPEFVGTYLNALIFFGKVYDVKAPAPNWMGKLDEAQAKLMQGYAAQVMK